MTIDLDDLKRIVSQLTDEERQSLLEAPEPMIPAFVWNSNPLAFKASLKYLEKKGKATRLEVRDYLRKLGLVDDPDDKCRFGILYTKTGVFFVDDSKSSGNIRKDVVSLTPGGRELAKLFNEDPSMLTPIEIVVCRGLQAQSSGYVFLSMIGRSPGIGRSDLWKRMTAEFGGKGRYYAGYYVAMYNRLGLLTTRRSGRNVKYYLTVPEGWVDEAPDNEDKGDESPN